MDENRRRRLAAGVLVGALLALVVACSPGDASPEPAAPTTTKATTTTTDEPPDPPAADSITAETITACRDLADDEGLAGYWSEVAEGAPSAPAAMAAVGAIQQLEVHLPVPEVDPAVVAAIQAATDAVAADGTLPARPDEFRAVVSPIVDACMALDVDMAVE